MEPISVLSPKKHANAPKYSRSPYTLHMSWPHIPDVTVWNMVKKTEVLHSSGAQEVSTSLFPLLLVLYFPSQAIIDFLLHRNWFVHSKPTTLQLSGTKLVDVLCPGNFFIPVTIDILSALVRMMQAMDTQMYKNSICARWRHFLPPEWGVIYMRLLLHHMF